MRRVTAVVAALAFVLAACGDDDGGSGPDVEAVGEQLGCDPLEEVETEELFVRELYECGDGEAVNRLYTFNTAKGRDDWLAIAEDFGAVVLDEGDDWVLVEP